MTNARDHVEEVPFRRLRGTFAFLLQGFLEAVPFSNPELQNVPPAPAPNGQEFTRPSVMVAFKPGTDEFQQPGGYDYRTGYYPFAEGGYLTFDPGKLTFTGEFRLNLGGNSVHMIRRES